MISREMLYQKPIDLRHICLFYLGHMWVFELARCFGLLLITLSPTFLDIHLTKMIRGSHTEPEHFKVGRPIESAKLTFTGHFRTRYRSRCRRPD